MEIDKDAGNLVRLLDFLRNKRPEESLRDAVVRFYMELGEAARVTATRDVGVIIDGVKMGSVDCALASPASIAVVFAEEKNDGLLGLWKLAELAPKTGVLAISSNDPSLTTELATIARKSYLLRSSQVKFMILDIEGNRSEILQRNGPPQGRKKIIHGRRQAYKKQD
jgi:hypothetical protein